MSVPRTYEKKLLAISNTRGLTADEIGSIMNGYGPDCVTRLRARKDMRVEIVGERNGVTGRPKKLYKVYKVDPIRGAYCCGYCQMQRNLASSASTSS